MEENRKDIRGTAENAPSSEERKQAAREWLAGYIRRVQASANPPAKKQEDSSC